MQYFIFPEEHNSVHIMLPPQTLLISLYFFSLPAIIRHVMHIITVCLGKGPAEQWGAMAHELHSTMLMCRDGHRQRQSGLCSASLPIIWLWSKTQKLIPAPFTDCVFMCSVSCALSTKAV